VPALMLNLSAVTNLYLNQNRKYHGLPSNEKVNSGSKLNLFLPIDISNIAAGLLNEKVGINEIPLLVTPIEPDKKLVLFVLSFF
jgi:hypothetical protein